jgi:uncharacterized protein (TIGR02145 family)
MKQLLIAIVLTSALFSCKKETTTPNNSGNNTTDTTKTYNDVSVSGFDCAGVKIVGTLTKDKIASNVTATLTYTGGNGKTYLTKSHTSTGVTGLTATLSAGTLANGEGTLQFLISGTPATAGTASISIAFGGKTCAISLVVKDAAQIIGKLGPNITDNEGNTYKTVTIGTQTWMAENLKVSKYNDGSTIPFVTDDTQWSKLNSGAWSYYNNDSANNVKYGKLYNWYVVSKTTNGNKNVCPIGWHMPTDTEWTVLTDYLGGESVAGNKMKEEGTSSWFSPNTDATNTSLFTGLPGGFRSYYGYYANFSFVGYFWSSTENGTASVFTRYLNVSGYAERNIDKRRNGMSIRCLKD